MINRMDTGSLHLYDIWSDVLEKNKMRSKRIKNETIKLFHHKDKNKFKKMKENFDVVVVDAPCSNTGIIRRKPELKIFFNDFHMKHNVFL